jgi:hypothetical protein
MPFDLKEGHVLLCPHYNHAIIQLLIVISISSSSSVHKSLIFALTSLFYCYIYPDLAVDYSTC